MAEAVILFGLQALSTGALVAGGAALKKSLEPGDLKTPVLSEVEREEPGRRAARAASAERRRAGRRRGRGSTILTRGLLTQPSVARQTLGGA